MDKTPSQAPLKGSLKEVMQQRRMLLMEKEKAERERQEAERELIEQGIRPPSRQKTPDRTKVVPQQPAPRKKAIGEGEGAEALKEDMRVAEGSYSEVIKEYGLTMEHVMRFECLGVAKEVIETLRSLFTSLDKDDGGELSAVELYEALMAFGQKVTDDDVVEMMDEVDSDGSGSIDFEEFLTLALPGFRKTKPPKPRDFLVYGCRSAMFDDADGCTYNPDEETIANVEMPEQCFVKSGGKSWGGEEEEARDDGRDREKPKRKQFLELRLRFKRNIHDSLARTESASGGTIKLPLALGEDNWVERDYPFENKQAVTGQMGAGILFTAPAPPDPNRFPVPITKLKCVKFPNGPIFEDGERVDGFRIESITPQKLQISFDHKYGKYAAFPPPPYDLTVIQTGPGTNVRDLKAVVSARSFMPKWLPYVLTSKIPSNDRGDGVEVEIRTDLGELYNLPHDQNVPVFVSVSGPETRVQALREYEGARGREWALDMRSTDTSPSIMVLCEFRLAGHSRGLLAKVNREYGEVRLAACFTEQVASSSAMSLSHGWLACPPHPHVLPLITFAGPNISIHPPVKGISGTAFSKIVLGAKHLTAHQRNLIFLTVGMHSAWGLEHMHKHDIWHLDVKPDNLVIEVKGEMGDDDDIRRMRERINVRLADFAQCACISGTNLTLRGTAGFWAPEQVHTPSGSQGAGEVAEEGAEGEVTVAGGLRGEYWGGLKCRDPPVALDCDMSDRSDSWGWATTMLFMIGRLNDMKMMGHSGLLQQLLKEGYTPKLEGMFAYEHQPYLDMLTEDVVNSTAAYKAVEEKKNQFEDAIERHWMKCDPAWLACESALNDIDDDDLKQVGFYKRCPNIFRNVIDASIAILMPENKESMEWNTLKDLVGSMDFVNQLLNFERTKGLAATTTRIVNKYLHNPTFDPELFTEFNVPAADPSKHGQAYKVCYALGLWVIAIDRYNDTRKIVSPLQNDLKQKQRQLDKLLPVLESERQKLNEYSALVKNLKRKLLENYRQIVAIMLNFERTDAQQMVSGMIGMEGTLTNQQYFRLLREVHHSVGELALIFRHLSDSMPPREVTDQLKSLKEGGANKPFYSRKDAPFEPDRKQKVSVFQKFAFLGYSERVRTPKEAKEGSRPHTAAQDTENSQKEEVSSAAASNGLPDASAGSMSGTPIGIESILSLSSPDEPIAPNIEALATLVATSSRPQSPLGGSSSGVGSPLAAGSAHQSGSITVFPSIRNALPPPIATNQAQVLLLDGDSHDLRNMTPTGSGPLDFNADSQRSDPKSRGGTPSISSGKATLLPSPAPAVVAQPKQSALWRKAVVSTKMVARLNRQLVDVPIAGEVQQKLPRQHNRSGMVNKHFVGVREVGDPFILAVAWCLQTQPRDRMPMGTLCAVLQQLMPGQEWHSCSTVQGRSERCKPSTDADMAPTEEVNTTPLVAEALSGEKGGFEVLLLLERKGAAMEAEGRLLDARDRYLDAYGVAKDMTGKDGAKDGMFTVCCRLALCISRVWMKMDCFKMALDWYEISEGLLSAVFEEIENEGVRGGKVGAGFLFRGPPTAPHVAAERKDKYSIKQMRAREQTLQAKKLEARLMMLYAELLLVMQVSVDETSTMRKASKAFFDAHRLTELAWADTNADISKAMAGMARVLELQGRYREARSEYQRALETRGSVLSRDNYGGDEGMAGLLESLARVNELLGRPNIAMAQLERAKNIYAAAVGADCAGHLGVGKVLHNIGKLHMSQGRFQKAEDAFRDAFNHTTGCIADQAGPPFRPFNHQGITARAGDALQVRGHICASLGRWGQGKQDFRIAMECYRVALTGPNHERDNVQDFSGFKVAECYVGLGTCHAGAGEGWKAAGDDPAPLDVHIGEIRIDLHACPLPPSHLPQTRSVKPNPLPIESYQAAYQLVFQGVGHDKHLQLARISELLGGLFWDLGRLGVASDWFKRALEVREHLQGSKHLDLTTGLMSMAAILRLRGQLEFAVESTLRTLRVLSNSCGEYNVSTAYCLCDVAICKYPQLAIDHGVLFAKRQHCLQLQDEAEDRVVAWEKVVAQKAKEVKEIKKKTTIKRVVVKMKEDALQDAKNQHAGAVQGVRQAVENAALALKEFEAVEVKMLECVALLEEASRIHTMSVPHGSKHWEKQVGRLISNMKSDIASARKAVEEQVSSKQASSTGTTPRSHLSFDKDKLMGRSIEEVRVEIDNLELEQKHLQDKLNELLEGIGEDVLLTPRDTVDGKASLRGVSRRHSGGSHAALSPHPSGTLRSPHPSGTLKSALKNRMSDDVSMRASSPMGPGSDTIPLSTSSPSLNKPKSVLKKGSSMFGQSLSNLAKGLPDSPLARTVDGVSSEDPSRKSSMLSTQVAP